MARPRGRKRTARVTINLDRRSYDVLLTVAKRNDAPVAQIARRAVVEFLRHEEPSIDQGHAPARTAAMGSVRQRIMRDVSRRTVDFARGQHLPFGPNRLGVPYDSQLGLPRIASRIPISRGFIRTPQSSLLKYLERSWKRCRSYRERPFSIRFAGAEPPWSSANGATFPPSG